MEKKNYPQVCLEECKYKIRKNANVKIHNTELDSELDAQLMIELESDSDSE